MRLAGFAFAPRAIPTLAAAAFVALTLWLGAWQSGRAEEKAARQAMLEARVREPVLALAGPAGSAEPLLFRRVRVSGAFLAREQIFVDNRMHGLAAGFHVITPLALEGSRAVVLVNRGWVARTADYPRPPEVPVPAGPVVVEGLATLPPARFLELAADTVTGSVWQNLSIAAWSRRAGLEALPVVVNARPPAPGLAAVEERPDTGIAKHREYALTWYSLAATLVVLWVALNLRREAP